jgi:tRNA threonylcarbamoyladenosine biosynthesis protein TsaB
LRVIGIDTSTFTGGIALLDNGQVVAEYSAYVTRRNSESLMGVLDDLLHDLDWKARDLEGVAVAVGPGSFTGTRIGVTMAKVLGYSLDIPIGRVVTLDAIAANVVFAKSLVCPVICARRDLVYNAAYRVDGPRPEKVTEYNVGQIGEVVDAIKGRDDLNNQDYDKVMFLGDGAVRHRQVIEEKLGDLAVIGPPWYLGPRPGVVAVMGQRQIVAGNVIDARDLVPFYMGKSSAEKAQTECRPEERA